MSATINRAGARQRKVLMVVASPAVSTTLGWPMGFWASEFTHPWLAFTEVGYRPGVSLPSGMDYWSLGSSSIRARLSRDWSSRRLACEEAR